MSFEEKTKAFNEFLKSKNIVLSPKVAIADFRDADQGRGLKALADIEAGETLFTIPASSILRIETNQELAELAEKYELDSWSALVVQMMAVQNTPEWKPYFDILPTKFNTPMFWDSEETKKLLQGSALVSKIGREDADSLYEKLASTILKEPFFADMQPEHISNEAFHRMGSLIMSYAFDVPAIDKIGSSNALNEDSDEEEPEDGKAMVPPADILNSHTKLKNAQLTVPETPGGDFEMIASKPIHKGDQIYNIYGNQPSSDMLRRYGFVEVGGTNYEVVEISLDMITAAAQQVVGEKQASERAEQFAEFVGDIDSFDIGLSLDEEIDDNEDAVPELEFEPELLIFANCLAAPELKRKQFKEVVALSESEKLLELARQILLSVIARRKDEYGTIEELDMLSAPKSRAWLNKKDMCTQVRQSEMRVLEMAQDWLETADTVESLTSKKVRKK